MPDRDIEVPADQRTATHGGERGEDREGSTPEPGSGLDRRQERNNAKTEDGGEGKGAHSGGTDPTNP